MTKYNFVSRKREIRLKSLPDLIQGVRIGIKTWTAYDWLGIAAMLVGTLMLYFAIAASFVYGKDLFSMGISVLAFFVWLSGYLIVRINNLSKD
jgi:hypothetical protein